MHPRPVLLRHPSVPGAVWTRARDVVGARDRDNEHRVRFLELTQLAAAVIERLMHGESLKEAATGACTQMDVSLDAETLAVIAALLEDLEQRGVFIGVRAIEVVEVVEVVERKVFSE